MKTIFLHIGTHKTGTTSLQLFLDRCASALGAQGILYPRSGRSERIWWAHHALVEGVATTATASARNVWQEVKDEIGKWEGDEVIVSSEDFCLCDDNEMETVIGHFEGHRVVVIVYVRRPVDFALSLYKQHLMSNGHRSLHDYLGDVAERCDYHAIIRRWEACEGVQAVQVRVFDRVRTNPGKEVDFIHQIGGELDALRGCLRNPVNVSPSDAVLRTVRAVNRSASRLHGPNRPHRIVSGVARRVRKAIYKKHVAGRLLTAALRPWYRTDSIAREAGESHWRAGREKLEDPHRRFLEAYIDPKDRLYLTL